GLAKPVYMLGRSFEALLRGDIPADWPQSMYYRYWMHLADHYVSAHYGVRTKTHKLIYYYGEALDQPATIDDSKPKEWELFDLLADPSEMNSVYGRTEYADVQASLTLACRPSWATNRSSTSRWTTRQRLPAKSSVRTSQSNGPRI
ncbi:MAG: DUF4976 domain-containing protein, partial [Pseudomonadales bacterium]|nr:DUF4976 domain-containing protein [Pseudomonadales bacterium]